MDKTKVQRYHQAYDEWSKTAGGQQASEPSNILEIGTREYLRQRLKWAFLAGVDAAEREAEADHETTSLTS